MNMELDGSLTALIAVYPNRWQQAVSNPNLRDWFVNKLAGAGANMAERAVARLVIDRHAAGEQSQDGGNNG